MSYTKKQYKEALNIKEEISDELHEALEDELQYLDLDDIEEDVRYFRTFSDYVEYEYFDPNVYNGQTNGPAFDVIYQLNDYVTKGFTEEINIKELLINGNQLTELSDDQGCNQGYILKMNE